MVCIIEGGGVACLFLAYTIIVISNIAFIKIAVIEDARQKQSWLPYINIGFYEFIIFLIIWAHLKTMLTSPGYIPKGYQ